MKFVAVDVRRHTIINIKDYHQFCILRPLLVPHPVNIQKTTLKHECSNILITSSINLDQRTTYENVEYDSQSIMLAFEHLSQMHEAQVTRNLTMSLSSAGNDFKKNEKKKIYLENV